MVDKTVFSTKRENKQSASQMLESMINRRTGQRANMIALSEAKRLSDTDMGMTPITESANLEIERNVKHASVLDSLSIIQGTKNIAKNQLQMRERLLTEGYEYVRSRVLGDFIFESFWLDDSLKEANYEQIEESSNDLMDYIEENFVGSKVHKSNYSKLLENINIVIDEVVREAVDRIICEASENDEAFTEFSFSDADEDKLDEKLSELGRDEIVEFIKDKVVQVVQDEKNESEEKSKMFDEIDSSSTDSENTDDEETETSESFFINYADSESLMEGATTETLKIVFSQKCKDAKKAYNTGAGYIRDGKYKQAVKEYEKAKKLFNEMLKEVKKIDDTGLSNVCSWILSPLTGMFVASIGGGGGLNAGVSGVTQLPAYYFGIGLPVHIMRHVDVNTRNVWRDEKSGSKNYYKTILIDALNQNIDICNQMIQACKKGPKKKASVKEALSLSSNSSYTASEKHIISLLESETNFDLANSSFIELKSFVSALCKKIHEALMQHEYPCAVALMNEFENRLSSVPETVPPDVKSFIIGMTNMIYGAIPADDVIISRLGQRMGSPSIISPTVDMVSVSWTDVMVNIRTNFGSIKDYCASLIKDTQPKKEPVQYDERPSLQAMNSLTQTREMNRVVGGSIFESLMMMNIAGTEKIVNESYAGYSETDVEEGALVETLLQYTILETLDTLGIYKFRLNDINTLKRICVRAVSEGKTPVYGNSGRKVLSGGKTKKGRKRVRINTRKMRLKRRR